jgi:hypothetical protein
VLSAESDDPEFQPPPAANMGVKTEKAVGMKAALTVKITLENSSN